MISYTFERAKLVWGGLAHVLSIKGSLGFGVAEEAQILYSLTDICLFLISDHWQTAVGLFDSVVETLLLLFTDKLSPNHTERINKYREAAILFQGKVSLNILWNSMI